MVFANGTVQQGEWRKGKFEGRTQSAREISLIEGFKAQPDWKGLNTQVIDLWRKLGPFELERLVENSKLSISTSSQIGVLLQNDFKWSGEMTKNQPIANGIGRLQGNWGIFEGEIVLG